MSFHDETREVTYFDFKNSETRERMELWMDLTRARIANGNSLSEKDLQKISELLKIITQEGGYKIPREKGERKEQDETYERLLCWYVLKLRHEHGLDALQSKEVAAERFLTSIKTVENYMTKHWAKIEKFINQCGYEEVSGGFKHHLSLIKRGKPIPKYES